jgi:hypothetical protein
MKPIVLIAGNYLREQRWVVLVLLIWVFGSSVLLGADGNSALGDADFFLQQQAIYGVAFATFLAASAIQNERRSRRILSVLSKGVERREYLAGLLFGVGAVEAVYALAMAAGAFWMLRGSAVASAALAWVLLVLFLTAMLIAAIALFFSTFLHPLFALAATAITASIPAALALALGPADLPFVPVYPLFAYILHNSIKSGHAPSPVLFALAAVEIVAFWQCAVWIFARRDIAAAIE